MLSVAKLKEGIFVGPQIRKLLEDTEFPKLLSRQHKLAWESFREITENFLGNHRSPNYRDICHYIISNLLVNYRRINARINLKLHFLDSHLDFFPSNMGAVSDEAGERFHQDLKTMEQRHQGVWDGNMLGDYCWMLPKETDPDLYKKTYHN